MAQRSPLRVLQVVPYLHPTSAYGGTPRVVHGLCRALAQLGWQVEALTTDAFSIDRRRRPSDDRDLSYPVHTLPNVSNRLAYHAKAFLPMGLGAWMSAQLPRFDLVHLHELRTVATFRVAAECRRRRIPYALSGHGGFPHHGRRRLVKAILDRMLLPPLLSGAARLVAASEFERDQLAAFGLDRGRVEVLPHGLDLSEFGEALPAPGTQRRAWGLEHRPLVLFLGRIDPIKGLLLLLEGFARAQRHGPDAALVLAGPEGAGAGKLRRAAQALGIEGSVYWPGVLHDRERVAALVDADLLCFPADRDCFGLAPFEALACGTPVVALASGGSGEWLAQTGGAELVAADPAELGAAIHRSLSEPAAARSQAQAGAAYVRAHLGWQRIAPRYGVLYESLIDRDRHASGQPGRESLA